MNLPAPPQSLLGWREMRQLRRDTLGAYQLWRWRFGPAFQLRLLHQRHAFFYRSEAIAQVLKSQAQHFQRYPATMKVLGQWNGQSVLILEGDPWLRARRLLAPAFSPQRIRAYTEAMLAQVEGAFPGPGAYEVAPSMVSLTLRILCATIFGLQADPGALGARIARLGDIAMSELFLPGPIPAWVPLPFVWRKRRLIAGLRAYVEDLIQQRLRRGPGADLLSALLEASDEGGRLTPTQVRDEAMTLMLAGHDTTAAGLSWMLWCLARHPEVAARVAEEGRSLPDLQKLAYTEQVVKETLRLFPPAPAVFLRQVLREVEVDGFRLTPGTLVHLPSYVVHRDPSYFPDPERFDPDRFAPGQERPEFAWFPFGGGPRICLGQSFALLEMTLVAASLMRRFVPTVGPEPLGRALRLSLWPDRPLWVHLSPR